MSRRRQMGQSEITGTCEHGCKQIRTLTNADTRARRPPRWFIARCGGSIDGVSLWEEAHPTGAEIGPPTATSEQGGVVGVSMNPSHVFKATLFTAASRGLRGVRKHPEPGARSPATPRSHRQSRAVNCCRRKAPYMLLSTSNQGGKT